MLRSIVRMSLLTGCITASLAQQSHAQGMPSAPIGPTSLAECEKYVRDGWAYHKQLFARMSACSVNNRVPTSQWRPAYNRCAPVKFVIDVPPACVSITNEVDCVTKEIGARSRECWATASQNQQRQHDEAFEKALGNTAAGLPDLAKSNALGFAKWWASRRDWDSLVQTLSNVNKYKSEAERLRTVFDSRRDPLARTAELTKFFGPKDNQLSADLTRLAIKGVMATSHDALDALVKRTETFSVNVVAMEKAVAALNEQRKSSAAQIEEINVAIGQSQKDSIDLIQRERKAREAIEQQRKAREAIEQSATTPIEEDPEPNEASRSSPAYDPPSPDTTPSSDSSRHPDDRGRCGRYSGPGPGIVCEK